MGVGGWWQLMPTSAFRSYTSLLCGSFHWTIAIQTLITISNGCGWFLIASGANLIPDTPVDLVLAEQLLSQDYFQFLLGDWVQFHCWQSSGWTAVARLYSSARGQRRRATCGPVNKQLSQDYILLLEDREEQIIVVLWINCCRKALFIC